MRYEFATVHLMYGLHATDRIKMLGIFQNRRTALFFKSRVSGTRRCSEKKNHDKSHGGPSSNIRVERVGRTPKRRNVKFSLPSLPYSARLVPASTAVHVEHCKRFCIFLLQYFNRNSTREISIPGVGIILATARSLT